MTFDDSYDNRNRKTEQSLPAKVDSGKLKKKTLYRPQVTWDKDRKMMTENLPFYIYRHFLILISCCIIDRYAYLRPFLT